MKGFTMALSPQVSDLVLRLCVVLTKTSLKKLPFCWIDLHSVATENQKHTYLPNK